VTNSIGEVMRSYPIDNRGANNSKPKATQSIIDEYTFKLRKRLHDETLDRRMVAKIIQNLSEADIEDFADYALRKANNPGHAFVKLCSNVMAYKAL
jgi:hypothetical protein